MDIALSNLKKYFPSLPQNDLRKIYRARCERLRMLMHKGIPADIRCIIEARVRLAGESPISFVSHMPSTGRSSFAKKRRAKKLGVCYKCARWNCDTRCRNIGMASINREDKIKFIKDGLSKESLVDLRKTLETHPSGDVWKGIHHLWPLFEKEHKRYSLGNLTLKDPVCQVIRKLDGKPIPDR